MITNTLRLVTRPINPPAPRWVSFEHYITDFADIGQGWCKGRAVRPLLILPGLLHFLLFEHFTQIVINGIRRIESHSSSIQYCLRISVGLVWVIWGIPKIEMRTVSRIWDRRR